MRPLVLGLAAALFASPASARPALAPPSGSLGAGQRFIASAPPASGVAREHTRAVVLLYHAFDVGADPLGISSRRFEAHLDRLRDNGVSVVPLSALIDFVHGVRTLPDKVAVITIDDAHRSAYTKAYPLLRARRLPFTLGIPTAFVERSRQPTLRWAEIREMIASGLCELASHGHRHRRLSVLDHGAAEHELEESRRLIREHTGIAPIAYFYPLGANEGPAMDRVRRAGYRAAFTASGGAIAFGAFSPFELPRATVFRHDGPKRVGWMFSDAFLQRLPPRLTRAD